MHICLMSEQEREGTKRTCRHCKMMYARKYRADGRYRKKEHQHYLRTKDWPMTRAKTAVFIEVRAGRMSDPKTLKCVDCGAMAEVYDHRDYTRSIDVEPVCRVHNKKRGPGKFKTG